MPDLVMKFRHIYNSAVADLKSKWSLIYIAVCLLYILIIVTENEYFGIYFGKTVLTNIYIAHFSHFGDMFLYYNIIWFLYFAFFFYLIFDNKKTLSIVLILFAIFTPVLTEIVKLVIVDGYIIGNCRGFSGILYAMYGFAFYCIIGLSQRIEYKNEYGKPFTLFLIGILGLLPLLSLPETQAVIDGMVHTIRVDVMGHILGFLSGYIIAMVVRIKEYSNPLRSWKYAFIMFLSFCVLHLPHL